MEVIQTRSKGSVFAVMFLVAGTCIGAGMLALPVTTSTSGFFPSLVLMALCSIFMAITGLLFVEANLWLGTGAHIISMSNALLGWPGKIVAALLYLFIAYASLIAYTAGGGDLVRLTSTRLADISVSNGWAACIFVLGFSSIIYFGRRFVGRVNAALFIIMILAYLLLILGSLNEVSIHQLLRKNWVHGFYALPLLLTIFSYQTIVPSLVIYLEGNAKQLRLAIIGGTTIAFFVYLAWQWLVLGVVPLEGSPGLAQDFILGRTATESFRFYTQREWVASVSEFFAFFAIVTSCLGMGLGLFDFLADGLKVKNKGWLNSLWLMLLIVIPTCLLAIYWERAFLVALELTGGIGDAILNGIIPALMIWSGRYIQKRKGKILVGGGRSILIGVILFACFVLGVQLLGYYLHLSPLEELRALVERYTSQ